MPGKSPRIPLSVKLAYTAFVAVHVALTWQAYGPLNFLWFLRHRRARHSCSSPPDRAMPLSQRSRRRHFSADDALGQTWPLASPWPATTSSASPATCSTSRVPLQIRIASSFHSLAAAADFPDTYAASATIAAPRPFNPSSPRSFCSPVTSSAPRPRRIPFFFLLAKASTSILGLRPRRRRPQTFSPADALSGDDDPPLPPADLLADALGHDPSSLSLCRVSRPAKPVLSSAPPEPDRRSLTIDIPSAAVPRFAATDGPAEI